ncbi:MAG: type II secretion system protein [Gemmatimonadales bacterium]|nr:MAG: type II secretion system protein [Gemmatimonadales bacterium]
MSNKSMNKKGFTLIELLIVVVIIGILAAIAIPRFGQTRERAFISAMQSDLRGMLNAQELYFQATNAATNTPNYAYVITGTIDSEAAATTAGLSSFSPSPTVSIELSANGAAANGFVALATHASTSTECAVYLGEGSPTTGPLLATTPQGSIICAEGTP